MNTYIFGSEYFVYAAQAESKESAIAKIKTLLTNDAEVEDFENALLGEEFEYNNPSIVLVEDSAVIFQHINP